MRHISFKVEGNLPPKKDGANSMWNKEAEAPRLVALRHQALEALDGQPPFSSEIRLIARVHIGSSNAGNTSDLDNFITGICDGLMKADARANLHQLFSRPDNAVVHPRNVIAIDDDSQVIEIHAKKLTRESGDDWYEVEIEGK